MSQVNSPKHYTQGDIECIDAMVAAKGLDSVITYCELVAFKYLWRCREKGEYDQDLAKAEWYLKKAIQLRLSDVRKQPTSVNSEDFVGVKNIYIPDDNWEQNRSSAKQVFWDKEYPETD